jgi:hypothetical protein
VLTGLRGSLRLFEQRVRAAMERGESSRHGRCSDDRHSWVTCMAIVWGGMEGMGSGNRAVESWQAAAVVEYGWSLTIVRYCGDHHALVSHVEVVRENAGGSSAVHRSCWTAGGGTGRHGEAASSLVEAARAWRRGDDLDGMVAGRGRGAEHHLDERNPVVVLSDCYPEKNHVAPPELQAGWSRVALILLAAASNPPQLLLSAN